MAGTTDGVENVVLEDLIFDENKCERKSWILCSQRIPRSEIVFLCQFLTIWTIIIFCLIRVWFGASCEESTIYLTILSGVIGYILPNPKL